MKYPNAYKGVKKIAIGVLLEVIIGIIGIVTAVLARPGADANSLAAAGSLALVVIIASIVAFIFELVGLFQAKKDESNFSLALWMILFAIILSVIAAVCSLFPASYVLAKPICDVLVDACKVIMMVSIIAGIANIAEKNKEKEFAKHGRLLRMILIGLFLLGLVLQLLSGVIVNPAALDAMSILAIIGLVIELVANIWLVIYLLRAPKKLK